MPRDAGTAKGGVVGAVHRLLGHRRTAGRVMAVGIAVSLLALTVALAATSSGTAVTIFVVLLLVSCLASCVTVWLVSEHDAAALERQIDALRDRRSPPA